MTSKNGSVSLLSSIQIDATYVMIVVLGLLPMILLVLIDKPMFALAIPLAVIVAFLLLNPRLTFWLLLISLFVYAPQRIGATFAVHPFDLIMGLLFAGIVLEYLLKFKQGLKFSPFDTPFIILLLATIISLVFAYDISYAVVPCIRIFVIYLAFRAVYTYGQIIGVRKIINVYLWLVALHGAYNISLFIWQGGHERVFGPAHLGYETFSMTALPMAAAFMLWAQSTKQRVLYGSLAIMIGLGIVATQARGPMLAVAIAIPLLIFFAARKSRKESGRSSSHVLKLIFIPAVALISLVFLFKDTLFVGLLNRYDEIIISLTNPRGTIALRLILWETAIRTFLDNPITGIGIGNFRLVHHIYPDLKLMPLHWWIFGMSAHNVLLHYLAETGIVGFLALVTLSWKGLRHSYRGFMQKLSYPDNQVAASLFIAMVVFCVTILFMRAWTWGQGGYVMALLFGLLAAMRETREVKQLQ